MAASQWSPEPHTLRYWQWRVLLALMGCYLFYYTGRLTIGIALPLLEEDLGFSKQQLGWLAAAALASYGIGQAINGNLGDALGGRRMVTLGAIGSMALCWLFSFMHTAAGLLMVWTANGFVQSMGWAPGGKLIATWWPSQRRGLAFGLYMLAAGCATVLVWAASYLVLVWFEAEGPPRWRWLFRLPVAALGVAGVLFYLLARDSPREVGLEELHDGAAGAVPNEAPSATEPIGRSWLARYFAVLGNPWFLLAAVVIVFQSFARYGLLTWTTAYYKDSGIGVNEALVLTLSLPVGMGLGALVGGYLSDRWFLTRRAAAAALFLATSAACFLALRANPVAAEGDQRLGIALLFLSGFFVYGAQGPLWALCPELVGRTSAGTAVGLMDAMAYAGAAAQGPLLGYVVERESGAGYATLFLVLALVTGSGALLALASAAGPAPGAQQEAAR